jgi:LysM repeat protein
LKTNSRYAFLFELDPTDYKAWAKGLKKAGYATNPVYAQKLIDLIEKYNLHQFSNNDGSIVNTLVVTKVEKETSAEVTIAPTAEKTNILETKETDFNKFLYVNETKGIRAFAGTSLLLIANKYNLTLDKLLDFNDWDAKKSDILDKDELVFIQRKRKQGAVDIHVVQENETLHQIAQSEGIRLEILLKNNNLTMNQMPAVGEKLLLKAKATTTPKLLSKK